MLGLAPSTIPELKREALEGLWVKILALSWAKKALLGGLAVSVLGDIFLIPSDEEYAQKRKESKEKAAGKKVNAAPAPIGLDFQVGTGFFALAHIAYTLSFILTPNRQSFSPAAFAISTSTGLLISALLGLLPPRPAPRNSWRPNLALPADMKPLVTAYILIINLMVGIATATAGGETGYQRAVGAWLFMISDAFVAVDAFGKPPVVGWKARAVGWMCYFWAQMGLAGTVSGL